MDSAQVMSNSFEGARERMQWRGGQPVPQRLTPLPQQQADWGQEMWGWVRARASPATALLKVA